MVYFMLVFLKNKRCTFGLHVGSMCSYSIELTFVAEKENKVLVRGEDRLVN